MLVRVLYVYVFTTSSMCSCSCSCSSLYGTFCRPPFFCSSRFRCLNEFLLCAVVDLFVSFKISSTILIRSTVVWNMHIRHLVNSKSFKARSLCRYLYFAACAFYNNSFLSWWWWWWWCGTMSHSFLLLLLFPLLCFSFFLCVSRMKNRMLITFKRIFLFPFRLFNEPTYVSIMRTRICCYYDDVSVA